MGQLKKVIALQTAMTKIPTLVTPLTEIKLPYIKWVKRRQNVHSDVMESGISEQRKLNLVKFKGRGFIHHRVDAVQLSSKDTVRCSFWLVALAYGTLNLSFF